MKTLRTIAAALLFAGGVYANPAEEVELKHPLNLETVADQGVEVNTELSVKARKLANYTFERPIKNSFHVVEGKVIGAFAEINLEVKDYLIIVLDRQNENGKDCLELSARTLKNDGSLESEIVMRDTGLDGNTDYAFTRTKDENEEWNIDKKLSISDQKTEHKEFFQKKYEIFLNNFLEFYESNTSQDDEWTSQYFAGRARKLKDFLANSEKGERRVEKNENHTEGVVRFTHNNKGYHIYFFSNKNNLTDESSDFLGISVFSSENDRRRYLYLRDDAALGRILSGESIFYKSKDNEALLPDLEKGLKINESDYIQHTNYTVMFGEEDKRKKAFFQAEYDKVLDELIEFYEQK